LRPVRTGRNAHKTQGFAESVVQEVAPFGVTLVEPAPKVFIGRAGDALNDAFETFNVLNASFRASPQPRHVCRTRLLRGRSVKATLRDPESLKVAFTDSAR